MTPEPPKVPEPPSVHDNVVYSTTHDLERELLVLHTEYADSSGHEFTDVRFTGVVAHHFDDVAAPSVLFDVDEWPVDLLVEHWNDLFLSRKNYSWPVPFGDLRELAISLSNRGVRGFRVAGSIGLDGFVLATNLELVTRTSRVAVEV